MSQADPSGSSNLPAYAQSLGIRHCRNEDGLPVLTVDFGSSVEGRPQHYHGGATSGLLENAGYAALRVTLSDMGRTHQLKPINITVQFLSAGKAKPMFAKGRITKIGRRNANLLVEAWQDDRNRPVATAIMNILMVPIHD